jgi:hypothetical protein
MHPFTSLRALIIASAMSVLLPACGSKNGDPQVAAPVPKALLSGQIQPADAATAVTATDAGNHAYTVSLSSTGAYSFAAIPVGTYQLSFTTSARYAAPAVAPIVVLGAGGATVPTITLLRSAAAASYQLDGVSKTAKEITCEDFYGTFILTIDPIKNLSLQPDADQVTLYFSDKVEVGSKAAGWGECNYLRERNGRSYALLNGNISGANQGRIEITEIDRSLHLISGRFSFVAIDPPNPGSPTVITIPNVNVTEGVFTNAHYF